MWWLNLIHLMGLILPSPSFGRTGNSVGKDFTLRLNSEQEMWGPGQFLDPHHEIRSWDHLWELHLRRRRGPGQSPSGSSKVRCSLHPYSQCYPWKSQVSPQSSATRWKCWDLHQITVWSSLNMWIRSCTQEHSYPGPASSGYLRQKNLRETTAARRPNSYRRYRDMPYTWASQSPDGQPDCKLQPRLRQTRTKRSPSSSKPEETESASVPGQVSQLWTITQWTRMPR